MLTMQNERSFFLELESTAKRLSIASTRTDSEHLRGLFEEIRTDFGGTADPDVPATASVSDAARGRAR